MTDPLLLDLPTSIQTQRLHLRVPRAGDGEGLHAAVSESHTELRQFLSLLPWVANPSTPETAEARCRTGSANFIARKDLPFLVFEKASNQLIGGAGLHRTVWATPKTEVGYWIRTSRSRQRFITEAVAALVDYAFEQMHVVRVELITDEANEQSRRVAERCHFTLEGTHHSERRAPDGPLRNPCVYAKLKRAP